MKDQEVGQPGNLPLASAHRTSPLPAFTPGPWVYSFESFDPEWAVVTTSGGSVIANVNADHRQNGNTRLIAASPDFFAAAKGLIEAWDARTAMAQQIITGKSDRDLQKQAMDAIEGLRAALLLATGGKE